MSSESAANPYSLGAALERSEFAWTDGDVEFTAKEIRVRGDFELPRICIHTGATEDLIRLEHTVVAVPSFYVAIQWLCVVVALVPIFAPLMGKLLEGRLSPSIAVLLKQNFVTGIPKFSIAVLLLSVSVLPRWIGNKINVTWYESRNAVALEGKPRNWLWVFLVLLGGSMAAVVSVGLGYFLLLFLGIAGVVAGRVLRKQQMMQARSWTNGRFILTGHSTAFAHAWAEKTAAADTGNMAELAPSDTIG